LYRQKKISHHPGRLFPNLLPVNGTDNLGPHGSSNQNKNTMYHGGRHLTKAAIAANPRLQGIEKSNQGSGSQEWL
jgi:hypothetical protein